MVEVVPIVKFEQSILLEKIGVSDFSKCVFASNRTAQVFAVGHGSKLSIAQHFFDSKELEYQLVDDVELEGDVIRSITFLELLDFNEPSSKKKLRPPNGTFVVGMNSGWLRWFLPDGNLIMSHRLHDSAVLRISITHNILSFLYDGGVIAFIEADVMSSVIRSCSIKSGPLAGAPSRLTYQKYEVDSQRLINDVVTCAKQEDQPASWYPKHQKSSNEREKEKFFAICGGSFPMLGVYLPSDKYGTLESAVAFASKLTSAMFSMAKSWWSSGDDGASSASKEQKIEEGKPLDMGSSLNDSIREIKVLSVAPSGNLIAASDNFGRVLLIDSQLHVIIRMWKGYREAQLAWIEQREGEGKGNVSVLLAVYAPRRGVLEVWKVRHGQREAIMDVGLGCTLVQSLPFLVSEPAGNTCCYLLRPSGEFQRIQFSLELSKHLKEDQATLKIIKQLVSDKKSDQVLSEVKKMRHPKLLVQAVLALQSDPSSLFLEVVNAALEQCNKNSVQDTPLKASKVL